jgi:hydrogenase-4 component F
VTSAAALVWASPSLTVAAGLAPSLARHPRAADRVAVAGGVAAGAATAALAVVGLAGGDEVQSGSWWRLDAGGAVFLGVIAVVGLLSVLASPAWLAQAGRLGAGALRMRRSYYAALGLFWATLVAVPLAGNLGVAWLLVEATTAASALLVAFSGRRSALEAGWKYLVLTSVGLTIALLGIVLLVARLSPSGAELAALDWSALADAAPRGAGDEAVLVAYLLLIAGLAAKVGWAPVHNWLPDAHSEAPPPVSALLSAALLPAVALVAWRADVALAAAVGPDVRRTVFIGFGLASLAVAIPFLWRPLAWKRLLAYSSLEHMGVIALAIGIATPLATAGALLHVAGHAVAKSLGFLSAVPLLRHQPAASRRPPRGLVRVGRPLAAAVGVSLGALSGLPPSPLLLSELLVLLAAAQAGLAWVTVLGAALLALGFLGLAQVMVDALAGRPTGTRMTGRRERRRVSVLVVSAVVMLAALLALGFLLPDTAPVTALTGGGGGG